MNLKNKIIVLDNVLSIDECMSAIKKFEDNKSLQRPHKGSLFLDVDSNIPSLYNTAEKVRDSISFLSNEIEIEWSFLVRWENGAGQGYHYDDASSNTIFTSITYLNTEFVGGETSFFRDMKIIPKVGRTVYFDGNHYKHGVIPVTSGLRYTLPIWYKNKGP